MAAPENISIMKAAEIDSESLAVISKRAFESDVTAGAQKQSGPPGYDSAPSYIKMLQFLDCYVILVGGEAVGGTMVKVVGGHGVVERIFVDPNHQRRGIGSKAMQLVLERYPEVSLWTLGAQEGDERANRYFEKLGFKQIGWDYNEPEFRGRWYEKRVGDARVIVPISSIKDGMNNIMVEGKIVEKSLPRMVRSKRTRESLTVADAALEDESGRIVMTLWNKQVELVKVGGRIRVEKGYTTSYRGITQLNVGYGRLIIIS